MTNKQKEYPTPKFHTLEEEEKYWASHSPLMDGYGGKVQKQKQNRASFLSVRMNGEELKRLRDIAVRYGVGPSTYARQLLINGMELAGERNLPADLPQSLCRLSPQDIKTAGRVLKQLLKLQDDIACLKAQTGLYGEMPETIESGKGKCEAENPVLVYDRVRDKSNLKTRRSHRDQKISSHD